MWKCEKCGREFKAKEQNHFCSVYPATIDEYIEAQDEAVRPILQKMRETIHTAAPEATEKMSYRMPTFYLKGNLVHFAAFKKHVSFFPGDMTGKPFLDKLSGYATSKGTIQFPLSEPIPYDLITEIVLFRAAEALGK